MSLRYRFIDFATRADRQAEFAKLTGYGPTNPDAFQSIPQELAEKMATYPANRKNAYVQNADWYNQVGPDGKTNADRLTQRWNEWITR